MGYALSDLNRGVIDTLVDGLATKCELILLEDALDMDEGALPRAVRVVLKS